MKQMPDDEYFLIDCKPQHNTDLHKGGNNPAYRPGIPRQAIHTPDKQIIQQVSARLGLTFISESEATGEVCFANERGLRPEFRQSFTATDLVDYIQAILHNPGNGEKYRDFLKTGVAQIPYPTNIDDFWQLVQTGSRLG